MNFKNITLKPMVNWIAASAATMLCFILYAVYLTDFTLTHLSSPPAITIGGLALYQYCAILWLAVAFERLDYKIPIYAALISIILWHFSIIGRFSMLTTDILAGGIHGDPSFHFFDKHAVTQYVFMVGWGTVAYKAFKKNLPDLKILTISGGVLFLIITGYHLIGYWSVFSQGDLQTRNNDNQVIEKLVDQEDLDLLSKCSMFDDLQCFRFNAIDDGYPIELTTFNSAITNSIVSLSKETVTQSLDFRYSSLQRDTLFEDNYSEYYSRTFYFDQRAGIVTYVISNYFGDISVNYLATTSWMMLGALVFWSWILNGAGIIHSRVLAKRSATKPSNKSILAILATVTILSPLLGWMSLDMFLGSNPAIFLTLVVAGLGRMIYKKMWATLLFFGSLTAFATPAIYIYVVGIIEHYGEVNPPAFKQFSFNALMATVTTTLCLMPLTLLIFKRYFTHKKVLIIAIPVLIAITALYTYIGTHVIFPDLIASSEQVRLDHLLSSDKPFNEFCSTYNFDVCQSVNNYEWKSSFFTPLMSSVWYMVLSGIISVNASIYLTSSFIHGRKRKRRQQVTH